MNQNQQLDYDPSPSTSDFTGSDPAGTPSVTESCESPSVPAGRLAESRFPAEVSGEEQIQELTFGAASSTLPKPGLFSAIKRGLRYLATRVPVRALLVGKTYHRLNGFDLRKDSDTWGVIPPNRLTIHSENHRHAQCFVSSPPDKVNKFLAGLDIPYQDYVFVDYGSGKGRALLLASEFPFRRIIGVEFAEELHAIAETNARRYKSATQKCRSITPLNMDASVFVPPFEPLVLYFYHPFDREVMSAVLHNLELSYVAAPRDMRIGYLYPHHGDLFEQKSFLQLVRRADNLAVFRTREVIESSGSRTVAEAS